MAPTLDASTPAGVFADAGATALTTAAFTPPAGSLIVVKGTASSTVPITSVTGTGLTFTRYTLNAPASHCSQSIWIATGHGTSTTVTATWTSAAFIGMFVEVWTGAQLAATPATHVAQSSAGGAPSDTIVTAAAGSVVTWIDSDWVPVSGATRTYRSGAVETFYHLDSGQFGMYTAYQAAPTAGSQTYGLTAPTGQVWTLSAIELQAAATNTQYAVTGTATATSGVSGSPVAAHPITGTVAATSTDAGMVIIQRAAVGLVAGSSTTAGQVGKLQSAAGQVGVVSTVAGNATAAHLIGGSTAAVTTTAGTPTAIHPITGDVDSLSTGSGGVTAVLPTTGQVDAGSSTAADIAATFMVDGGSDVISTVDGDPTATHAVDGAVEIGSVLTGNPLPQGSLAGSVAATSDSAGEVLVIHSGTARDLRILATTVPTLAWTANGPTTAWTTGLPAQPVLATTSPQSAWTTTTPDH